MGPHAGNPILGHTQKILLNVEKPDPERFWPKPGTNGLTRTNCSIFDDTYDAPIRRVTTDCYRKVITYEHLFINFV